ncbi:hydroxyethylthiazole kinase [Spelaeicoccus albus]|uniref:Hydroxyethylthiazole kinase n=1 Tax=Spelaeicoccus albus TaxID=1280376 RepID=A0A7Z0A8Z4_9MICO|nr:hydroxyethylthiazole kinase [Spelaeicoccus albus]NYI65760.1 hydroxyethylthiazole kinase [Spelaeicoccus albus]
MDVAYTSEVLARVRATNPLVQCLTNSVVTGFTANVLLALGASPAMTDVPRESGPFAEIASAVLINTGTPHAEQRNAMAEAAKAAHRAGTPWVLDPVAVGSLPVRTALARGLLDFRPTAVRGNPSEIIALAELGGGGRGTDAIDTPDDALPAGAALAASCGAVTAVSGRVDLVTDGTRVIRSASGTSLLTKITGGGCALGAVTAAFLAVAGADRSGGEPADGPGAVLNATAAATVVYTAAAEMAAESAGGPGTFAGLFLDALAAVDTADIERRAALS